MLGHKLFELSDQLRVPAEHELGLDPLLERRKTNFLEPVDRHLGEGFVGEVRECGPAPESERPAKEVCGSRCVPTRECLNRVFGAPLEAAQVELVARDSNHISGRAGLDPGRGADDLAQSGDLPLHLGHRGHRRRTRVEVFGQPLDGDHSVCAQEQDREGRTLLRPSEPKRALVTHDLERSEDAVLEHSVGR